MAMVALIDIDGVCANPGNRIAFINPSNKAELGPDWKPDWDSFFDAMAEDKPIIPVRDFLWAIEFKYHIVYITGRPHSHREVTLEWLQANTFPRGMLVMRASKDHRPDYKVKRELYEKVVIPFCGKADLVLEDRDQVVEMWRELGLLCLQPCKGNY